MNCEKALFLTLGAFTLKELLDKSNTSRDLRKVLESEAALSALERIYELERREQESLDDFLDLYEEKYGPYEEELSLGEAVESENIPSLRVQLRRARREQRGEQFMETVLRLATKLRKGKVIEFGYNNGKYTFSPVYAVIWALEDGDNEAVEYLESEFKLDYDFGLVIAAKEGSLVGIKYFLSKGARSVAMAISDSLMRSDGEETAAVRYLLSSPAMTSKQIDKFLDDAFVWDEVRNLEILLKYFDLNREQLLRSVRKENKNAKKIIEFLENY